MIDAYGPSDVDLIRWTFTSSVEGREAIEAYLVDLGLDVLVVGENRFHVSWEEPDRDMNEVASELWDLNGEPFEIAQEEYHRLGHFLIHADEDEAGDAQAA